MVDSLPKFFWRNSDEWKCVTNVTHDERAGEAAQRAGVKLPEEWELTSKYGKEVWFIDAAPIAKTLYCGEEPARGNEGRYVVCKGHPHRKASTKREGKKLQKFCVARTPPWSNHYQSSFGETVTSGNVSST